MKKSIVTLILCLTVTTLAAGNKIYSHRFKSLTSIVNNDWMNRPVMTMGTGDVLHIGFDELSHTYHRLTYHLDHCEANWRVSDDIFESDWLDGFNDNQIEDYQNSINTTVLYTHYQFSIPNDRCRLKMSGNYRLTVIDEDNDDEKVLEVEFYVLEPLMDIGLGMTTNTDVDHNDSHQQLSMTVKYNSLRVNNLDNELQTVVMQNWREETSRRNITPNYITTNGLTWEHNRALIFDAGNQYHKFEILDVSHATMGLDRITWDGHYYQAYPFPTGIRRNYLTDTDANGAFLIRNSNNYESNVTCDYVWVNYQLMAPYCGELYVTGQFATDAKRSTYRMDYDEEHHHYYASVLQKQGYYNYIYVRPDGSLPALEGSFFQTDNSYQAFVYYKGTGERTWRLVGYRGIKTP